MPDGPAETRVPSRPRPTRAPVSRFRLRQLLQRASALSALIVIVIASSLTSDRFLSVENLLNVIEQIAIVGVLALGMTFVILTAGIDLSVGSIVALTAVVAAMTVNSYGIAPGIVVALLVGAAAGAVNGMGVVVARIQPFIMTLATMAIGSGLAFILSQGLPIAVRVLGFTNLGVGRLAGIPIPAIVFVCITLLVGFVLTKSVFGRSVFAVGSNREAARLSGIPTGRVIFSVYVISGLCAAVGGILYAAELGTGTPNAGSGIELDAIAATVIGGTSLFGGVGTTSGTFIGAAILGVLANILNLVGVQTYVQDVVKGVIIIVAILLQYLTGVARVRS